MRLSFLLLSLLSSLAVLCGGLRAGEVAVKEPDKAEAATPRKPERSRWSWNAAQADLTESGDLKWKPAPFKFEPSANVKYIDFDGGKDDNAGTKNAPWKRHPWDPAASGNAKAAKGAATYVFKRGVIYRGTLNATETGSADQPIKLTSDPAWGQGEAKIYGSERVSGWKQGATNKSIPESEKVWYADVDFLPRNVWEVKGEQAERIALARTPNWKVSDTEDVMSEWFKWEQPEWWTKKWHIDTPKGKRHLGVDKVNLTKGEDYYKDAIVRTEYAIVMGTPYPVKVEAYNAEHKGIVFEGLWFGDSAQINTGNRYYLEDKPHYLDAPGEFWFERNGNENGGRLFLRLTGDADPNKATIEAARHAALIQDKCAATMPDRTDILGAKANDLDVTGLNNVVISGLTFGFTNTHWDLHFPAWMHKDVRNAAIRLMGSNDNIRIANCKFEHTAKAVRISGLNDKVRTDRVLVSDNEIRFTDHGAIEIGGKGELGDAKALRNSLYMVGMRPHRQDHGHALDVNFPVTMEIAGNMLDRCYGAGLFLFGGKQSGATHDCPLARNLVYHNRATNTLLACNDWGGIETWQGGPFYVYNNISGNANGYWNWGYRPDKPGSARLGFAYYLDGAFKNYHFNNVAWGISSDLKSKHCSHAAFYEATPTIENAKFNNTIYKFAVASNWSPAGGRHTFLGNLMMDVSHHVFTHGQLKEDKGTPAPSNYPHATMAYGSNVFYKLGQHFGFFESNGRQHDSAADFQKALEAYKPLRGDTGVIVDASPVVDAEKHDFRVKAGSPAIDKGVKYFVPWSLSGTVGEWNFHRNNADPSVALDSHWYLAAYYVERDHYHRVPVFNLKGGNISAENYTTGALEDWTSGAVKLNGKDQFFSLSTAEMGKPYTYEHQKKQITVKDGEIKSPNLDATNFSIEAYLRTEPGHNGSTIVSKMSDSGYQLSINKAGGVTLTVRAGAAAGAVASGAKINDGKWHHVLAEVDRAKRIGAIYIDGKKSVEATIALEPAATLANDADLLVGKGAAGGFFAGELDFLRIARGTLADSRTSIEELYDWQFDGPFLRDFLAQEANGKTRDAGAFELKP